MTFDELFATLLICYSSYILKEATFKYNLASIRIWLEINGIHFVVSIGLKYLVYVLRNAEIERSLFAISFFKAVWEAYALIIVYLFYKDQKSRTKLERQAAKVSADNPNFRIEGETPAMETIYSRFQNTRSDRPTTPDVVTENNENPECLEHAIQK